MRHWRLFIAIALTAALPAAKAWAPPPPPAFVPEHLRAPVEGYDVATIYQIWRSWVESHKGAAADKVLSRPESFGSWGGWGPPVIEVRRHDDFGHFMTMDVRRYCPAIEGRVMTPVQGCHYRLRSAYVDQSAGAQDGPLARWTQSNLDPRALVAHLRQEGLGPATDWWLADRNRLFSASPSPIDFLTGQVKVSAWDGEDCPALDQAVAVLEERALNLRIDLPGVGEDRYGSPPAPHSIRQGVILRFIAFGDVVTLSGGGELNRIVDPVLAATGGCEPSTR